MTELQVDVHGLRTFRVSDDGNLLPVTAVDDSWRGGVCIARCRRKATHRAPVERCRCGIYTFRSLGVLRGQYEQADFLVAVVALEGQTLAGVKGWRSQAGRVISLWIRPGALPHGLLAALRINLPEVEIFEEIAQMLLSYPELTLFGGDDPPGGRVGASPPVTRLPLRSRPIRTALLPLYALLIAVGVWMFVNAGFASRSAAGSAVPGWHAVQTWIDGCGRWIAGHEFDIATPLLVAGFSVYVRATRGIVSTVISILARGMLPVLIAAVPAAIILGNAVEINPLGVILMAMVLRLWGSLALHAISTTDGTAGHTARRILVATAAKAAGPGPRRPARGVSYRVRPEHSPSRYPLTVPVHFEAG